MDSKTDKQITRRDFFDNILQKVALAGLMALAGVLIFKKRDPSISEFCLNQGNCRVCSVLAGCPSPQALSAKQDLYRNKENGE
jgi:hypothetical protein